MASAKSEKRQGLRRLWPSAPVGVFSFLSAGGAAAACWLILLLPSAGFAQTSPGKSRAAIARPTNSAESAESEPSLDAPAIVAPTSKPHAAVVASAVHSELRGDKVRLVFTLSAPVPVKSFVIADPMRVVVDLPEVDFEIDPRVGLPADSEPAQSSRRPRTAQRRPSALISAYRFGLFAPGRSRIVIDLAAPARIVRAESEVVPGKRPQLVIELAPVDAAAFAAAAKAARAAREAQPPLASPAPVAAGNDGAVGDKPVIVIDPGHGGIDTGAVGGAGIVEKRIVLAFGKELAAKLEAGGRYKIVMTRSTDVFVPLSERVHIAQESNASLFISIHADDLPEAHASVSGATVYTESNRASDAEAARVAESENQADAVGGMDRSVHPADVSDILLDLTRRETRAYSNVFARILINCWSAVARLNKNPHRSAGFVVLESPDVPSVLLELGYLSSHRDVGELLSPQWRDKTTDAIVRSVNAFFAQRQVSGLPAKSDAGAIAMEPVGAAGSNH